jgi:tetrahydromethanopterin S-methyltransferase subunit G
MPVTMPKGLHDALGEKAAQEMTVWITDVLQERTVVRDEYREVLSRLDILEHRMGNVENQVSQLRTEMQGFRSDMDKRFDVLHERFDTLYDRMLVQTRWLIGSVILFGTVVTILLAIAQFKP